ncbi:trifunctional serine/threonine-protein kinase/ATP-binding protein/sensor histidine kinase [Oscillatoria acuminata]|uniref:histidine kinase n=1 Tax=Oscillatoria acuminata PCC 6304 TaxID=56110 RepID=K9TIX9_9CYAN|nr:ATP-binding sensor histidine kinase [Oscillatoria acuminata]AFY81979.1 putative ATPase [Oscillatoria acuminata PCC 6304]
MKNLEMTTRQSQPQLPGYTLTDLIYPGTRTHVYRGVHQQLQQPVVIKVMKREYPTFGELVQFRNQFVITKNIEIPGIVRTLALEAFGNGYAIVMEDSGSISIAQYLENQALNLLKILDIAIQLTTILHELHHHRIIHKDIKPANVLIHPDSGQVTLIDFSIASLLPKETQAIQSPQGLEGTLAYLAPEQTGRMNRGIDYRADFYALGVMLYELLTGQLPFSSDDPLEVIHSHIAKTPTPVHEVNPKIPAMLEAIVAKLMAKNAEDRYQSALGLQYDLQECLNQWQARGEISEFVLGQRDLSDRFIIPEKLYGREQEVQTLLKAFERVSQGASELMLVAGFSGIGKTAVVNEVHKPITQQKGYFIKGKFDQFNRNIPLSAFVQALRDLMGQLLCESDAQLAQWQARILDAVGENGQVLIEVIPELEQVMGQQPAAPELSDSAVQNRFNLLFQKFIQVFTTAAHPLTIFLDDLQWADAASLQLLKVLMDDNGYLLVLGAYRDNEVSPAHPLMLTIADLKKANFTVNTITLTPLSLEHTNRLIADTLKCDQALAKPLTQLVDRKTQGNPFFTTQFLKALHEDGYITFERNWGYWQCDMAQVNALALTDDVVEFMALQLQKLSAETQQVLKLAACIGNQFDLATLAIVFEQSPTETAIALWKVLQEGLLVPTTQVYKFFQSEDSELLVGQTCEIRSKINPAYRFLHDRVQQAAYLLIPEADKQATHLKIGKLLFHKTPETEREAQIFAIANQLNCAIQLLSDPTERNELAQLNLLAGQRAKASTAYTTAMQYLTTGIELLSQDCWQRHYDLTLALYQTSAESSYLLGDFEQTQILGAIVLNHAQTLLDQVSIYELKIQICVAKNQFLQGLDIARKILQQLGVDLPEQPTPEEFAQRFQATQQMMAGRKPLELLALPLMTDAQHQATLRILSSLFSITYNGCPAMFPLVMFTQVCLSIQYGNASFSAFAYASYGLILTAFLGDVETGYEFGQLAIQLLAKLNAKDMQAKTLSVVNCFLRHPYFPLRDTLKSFLEGYQGGLAAGDIEWACWCAFPYTLYLYMSGENLEIVKREMTIYHEAITHFKQNTIANYQASYYQSVLNLLGESKNLLLIQGQVYDEVKMMPVHQDSNDRPAVYHLYINKSKLCYLFGEYEQGLCALDVAEQHLDGVPGLYIIALLYFYDSLTRLALATDAMPPDWQRIQSNQEKLAQWAKNAPMNHQHKWDLAEAERCRVLHQTGEAIDLYDRAIAGAKENSYIQEEALANELAAKFYLDWGKEKVAAGYMQEAYYSYARWGAKAKVEDLEKRYPQLLQPILQAANQPLTVLETLTSIATSSVYSIHATSSKSTSSSINQTLDFAALLQISQTFASTIALDELLQTLTQTMLENSGADRGALMLCEDKQWQVRVLANLKQVTLQSAPLNDNPNVPVKLIQYVKNTVTTVVLDALKTDLPVIGDYLHRHQPKSVLCLPILNQGNLLAILYLENRSASGVFTGDRIVILNFLCTQAAISLENASLYQKVSNYSHTLEAEVVRQTQVLHQKNQELEQILKNLQQTQAQLIQTEKMSSLGQLVAGIAHEINNPINFIKGNIIPLANYWEDLKNLLELYREDGCQPSESLRIKQEEVDLEFLFRDVEKILKSMTNGSERIQQIVLSLRNFSRLDESSTKAVDLHSGIDSTLLILQHRLQQIGDSPEIQVVCDYGDLPRITCYPSQLNQVFLNIINNAIDAIRENSKCSDHPQIQIRTEPLAQKGIRIAIANTDSRIPPEIQDRIFDPFFTTKPVGSGTGLGLFVSYSIIQKHGGTLRVRSPASGGAEFEIILPYG